MKSNHRERRDSQRGQGKLLRRNKGKEIGQEGVEGRLSRVEGEGAVGF